MNLFEHPRYKGMLIQSIKRFSDWDALKGRKIVLSGGSGMLLSYMIDVIMMHNLMDHDHIQVVSIGRDENAFHERFALWKDNNLPLWFIRGDVSRAIEKCEMLDCADYVIHGASTTHPKDYVQHPISTIMTNVKGTQNMLELACAKEKCRFLLMSSVEIYGDNRSGKQSFSEDDCGYINCNTLRAGYSEGKRVSEALCQAYRAERGVESVVLRIPRSYGPTLRKSDSKALTQFLKNCLNGEDIVLKSKGEQLFSYAYVADVVQGILLALTHGKDGEAYNLADPASDVRLRDLAEMMANHSGTKVVFDLPDEQESKGFSAATVALINAEKLCGIGWQAAYSMESGLQETIDILKEIW